MLEDMNKILVRARNAMGK